MGIEAVHIIPYGERAGHTGGHPKPWEKSLRKTWSAHFFSGVQALLYFNTLYIYTNGDIDRSNNNSSEPTVIKKPKDT